MTGTARRRSRLGVLTLALTLVAVALPAAPVAAAEYEMVTRAGYVVDDAAGKVVVTIEIGFTNTFAPPAGQVSVFPSIRLAIHDHAAAVTAHDATGALTVTVAVESGVNVATITPRSPVKYGETAQMTLAYELRDGEDPAIRVGPHLVSFPAWGFGTQSEVRVELAADFDVRIDGDTMEATVEDDQTVLASGAIDDPTHWLTHVGATRAPSYETLQQAVPLAGGTADLQVRHWDDDPEWGAETLDLVATALPLLEEVFGIPYPGQGPIVITESVTAGGPDSDATDGELAVGFTEPPFTVLHQVAHVWAGTGITGDRWMLEGLASWAAGEVSTEMDIALPYDPLAVAADLAENAFPLAEWSTDERSGEAEGWAYAASWALTNQAAEATGPENFQLALRRMAAGMDGYDPLTDDPPEAQPVSTLITSRAYLDQLDAVTDAPVVEDLATPVLGEGAAAELTARTSARAARDALLLAADGWGDPDPVRAAMVDWQFADAETAIADAGEWLVGRDALLDEIEEAGLTAPERLRAAYQVHGGGTEAWAEIDAERAVVEAYAEAAAAIEDLDPIARVGLLLGPSPEERLATAATAFAAGDLRVAADELASLNQDLATATAGGLVRLLGIVVAVGATTLIVTTAVRRRRRTGTDYTPEP